MKKVIFLASTILVLTLGLSSAALGQYDDLYYDPDRDAGSYSTTIDRSQPVDQPATSRYDEGENYDNNTASYGQGYDDDEYDYYDDYDYFYSSRIRRFHRPYYGFSYFDPCYADLYYYDPYINPGVTVLIYDGFSSWNSWRSWRRFNRWNSWSSFNQGYGWGGGWNRWNDPWYGGGGWNNSYYGYSNNYYGNNYYGGGWNNWGGNGYYCPPSWGNGYNYNTINTNNNTYFGPRTTGGTLVPRKNDRSPGVQKPETGPLVPKEERQTTVSGSGLSPQPGSGRSYDRPAMEDGKTRTGVEGTGSPETPTRNTRPAVQDRNPVIERPTREGSTPSRPKYDEPQTPRREPAPSRQDVTPAPTRKKDDSPAREYRERSSSNNAGYERSRSTETPRTSTPSRSYDNSSSRQSTPSRSSNNSSGSSSSSSRQASPAPSRSNDGGSSKSSSPSPSRSNDNNGKSRSGGRNGG